MPPDRERTDPARAAESGSGGENGLLAERRHLRRQILAALVALAALAFVAILIAPAAASIARARARSRGVEMDVAHASIGWGSIRLSGVTIRVPELRGVGITLARVDLFPSLLLRLRRVEVLGGNVRALGAYDALGRDFTAFRRAHGMGPSEDGGAPSGAENVPSILVEGVDVTWRSQQASSDALNVWGIRYEREKDGREILGADLARLAVQGADLEVSHGRAELLREGPRRVLVRAAAQRSTTALDVDALTRTPNVEEPVIGDPPDDAKIRLPPQGTPIVPVAAITDSLRGQKLREKMRNLATALAALLPRSGRVDLPPTSFAVRHGRNTLNVGPAAVSVARENDAIHVSVTSGGSEGRTPLALGIDAPLGSGSVEVALAGGPLPLIALGVREGDMGLADLDRAEIEVNGKARLADDGSSLSLSGQGNVSDLTIHDARLAAGPVRGLRVSLGGALEIALDGSRVASGGVEVGVGKVKILARGALDREGGHARTALHLEVPLAACSDMLASIPQALVPRLSGLEVSGTFALRGDVSFDTRRPADVKVDVTAANACRLTNIPADLSPEKFRRPWTRRVLGPDRTPVQIDSGPGTAGWTPLFDVSPYVATGVVVCEDAHFYTHDGFDGKSIEDSIRDDLRAGKFVRGGSTVSMQLAKNLYLGREKTLSRKLEEAVLTVLLEQTLGKAGILELYLNVVELGPGIYGIGPAAWHYFRTTPRELSLAQSLYLVSLLPNPKAHHFAGDGSLRPKWAEYLRHLMEIAHKIHRITDAELAAGLADTVRFGVPGAAEGSRGPGEDAIDGEGNAGSEGLDMSPRDDAGDPRGP